MQQRSDDRLVAYLDGELEVAQRRKVEAWLDADPTARHRMAALAESARIVALDDDGKPSKDGKIVLMSLGMSNTAGVWATFKEKADRDPRKSSQVVIVNGAVGGAGARSWANGASAGPWRTFARITLPLAWRSIMTGVTLTYARSISEFGAVILLAYYPMTAPVKIYELCLRFGLDQAASAAVLLLVVSLALFLILRVLSRGVPSRASR